jgi:hypothetical protein
MGKAILLEEFHLTVFASKGLPEQEYDAIQETLKNQRFLSQLRSTVRTVFRQQPALGKVKVILSR